MGTPQPIPAGGADREAAIRAIERPHPSLLKLYAIQCLGGLFLFPVVFLPFFFKYRTLRYRFDEDGVSASWGLLFRREIYVTYRRVQDIHVSRNVIERWLGIGRVEIQTASGSSAAELALEGMTDHAGVRDFLYARMRGTTADSPEAKEAKEAAGAPTEGDAVHLLREIRREMEAVRRALEGSKE